jgi:hypothetical protein
MRRYDIKYGKGRKVSRTPITLNDGQSTRLVGCVLRGIRVNAWIPALQQSMSTRTCTASWSSAKHSVRHLVTWMQRGAFPPSIRLTPTVGCPRSPASTSYARPQSSPPSLGHVSITIALHDTHLSPLDITAPSTSRPQTTLRPRPGAASPLHNSARPPHVAHLRHAFGRAPSVSSTGEAVAVMDERESSTASSVDFYENDKRPETPPQEPQNGAVTKRKAEELAPSPEKKRKLSSPSPTTCAPISCAGLPAAVWQHVFLSCSLYDLGRLLQVNRAFHSYLIDVRNVSLHDPHAGSLRLLKSESLWASARNALPVKPPKPLQGFSELRMWQLAWAKRCQFCRKESSPILGEKLWQQGPGADGVRTIWPFGIKSCGTCLLARCKTVS